MIPKNTNIYLDIDGTIIHEEAGRLNQPAAHSHEFLKILKDYPVYWLTMRCRDGDPSQVLHYLQRILPKEVYQLTLLLFGLTIPLCPQIWMNSPDTMQQITL